MDPLKPLAKRLLRPGDIPVLEYGRHRPTVLKTWRAINARTLTYSSRDQLACLTRRVEQIERRNEIGEIIETSCALGGSAILMCAAKTRYRPMRVFDMFGMIPPPSDQDGPEMHARYQEIAAGRSAGLKGGK